ncbi:MAG: PilZ domain-containing protein [Desulfobulbus sp.]|nr:MAG: PilZ domain-containing protein [Desulfobulbus sp.]
MSDKAEGSFPTETRDEQRILNRHHLIYYLRVYNNTSNRVLGHVVDISPGGVMLITDEPVVPGEEYRLRMRFPGIGSSRDELIFETVCRWCRTDENPAFYLVGFQIHNLLPEEANFIQGIIRELAL